MARPSIPFQPARKRSLGFEIFKLSELRARLAANGADGVFDQPLRLDFHLLYIGLRGTGDLLVDFEPASLGKDWLTVVARGRPGRG